MVAAMPAPENRPAIGAAFVLAGMFFISINDLIIKQLSGDYPLHQMVFARSGIGICFSLVLVWWEGGLRILRTDRPGLHLLRGLLVVAANMTYFAALAAMPLAEATALFFVAPLFITLLSIPLLGEQVGPLRLFAVAAGFVGVLVILRPWAGGDGAPAPFWIMLLPSLAALAYAMMQILTRRLGGGTKASAMAVYIQGMFLVVGAGFWAAAGDGRFAEGLENESLVFLLRAWAWPAEGDWPLFVALGLCSAVIGYALSQAYRMADAAVVAPFEYVALPLAIFWGWTIWGELPDLTTMAGIALIMAAGVFVFLRERFRKKPLAARRSWKRW